MSTAGRGAAGLGVAVVFAMIVAGCSKSNPAAPPAPTRQVAATVVDSTGAPMKGTGVFAVRLDVSEFTVQPTDSSGVARFALHDGRCCLSAAPVHDPLYVAASVGTVAQKPAGSVDSVLFRLVARPESHGIGKVTLDRQTTHEGTEVLVVEFPAAALTASDGSYDLTPLPPGTWTGVAEHNGFEPKEFTIVVPAAGDTVTAGLSFTLLAAPGARP